MGSLFKRLVVVCAIVIEFSLVFYTDSFYTYPWFLVRLLASVLVVSGLALYAKYEPREMREREAEISA